MLKANAKAIKSLAKATLTLARVIQASIDDAFWSNPGLINHPRRKEYIESRIKKSLESVNNKLARLKK